MRNELTSSASAATNVAVPFGVSTIHSRDGFAVAKSASEPPPSVRNRNRALSTRYRIRRWSMSSLSETSPVTAPVPPSAPPLDVRVVADRYEVARYLVGLDGDRVDRNRGPGLRAGGRDGERGRDRGRSGVRDRLHAVVKRQRCRQSPRNRLCSQRRSQRSPDSPLQRRRVVCSLRIARLRGGDRKSGF